MLRLLIADGDDAHRHELAVRLRSDGFDVSTAARLCDALELISRSWPHLVVTELRLADGTAWQLARELERHGDVPFVVVTANGDQDARVRALNGFADDFLDRPYCYAELLARIRCVLRRALIVSRLGDERVPLGNGRWVDVSRREIYDGDRVVRLTPTETRLLGLFLLNAGQILPADLILQRVWGNAPAEANALWEYVRRLRLKLGDDARSPRYLVSVRGIGYQFKRMTNED